jgi:methylated-DNA-[protein]-cysteine S-methyltransferase
MTDDISDQQVAERLLLAGQHPNDGASLDRLRARLAGAAEQRGLLDVGYATVPTPVGSLLLAATERGLVRVAFDCERHEAVLADLALRLSPRVLHAPARLQDAARQIEEYFAGRRRVFDLRLDLTLTGPGFRREVVSHLSDIRYGATATYTMLAAISGRPRAVRAAASACARNPLPVVLPCHRIVRSDATLGGYVGGLPAKRTLLTLEAGAAA